MKKIMLLLAVLFVPILVVTADDEAFYNALQNCSSYSSQGVVNADGINVNVETKIAGWENNRCVYKETLDFSGVKSCTTCRFKQQHIDELVQVMRAYNTVQKYTSEKVDTSSISKVKDNPVVKVWNKYLQDSSVCTIDLKN